MTPIERSYILYLEEMLDSMKRIQAYIEGLNYDEFQKNSLVLDAVIRNFEVLGEASKNVPEEIKVRYPDIPWKEMYGLRNLVTHAYFGVDYEILWEIAKNHLPANRTELEKIIEHVRKG